MNLTVKSVWEIEPEVLTHFFEHIDYGHAPHWAGCYCRFYHTDVDFKQWQKRDPSVNRDEAIQSIRQKEIHGFLAFDQKKCIGWLNANDAKSFVRLKSVMYPWVFEKRIAMTICFVIDPQYRNQKVATRLLETAIRHYRDLGYDGMISAPMESKGTFDLNYRGTLPMYLKSGYTVIEQIDSLSICYLDFHKVDQQVMQK